MLKRLGHSCTLVCDGLEVLGDANVLI
jgi:hypothetical protein